jgi:membrane-associated phospholipid phosphatase
MNWQSISPLPQRLSAAWALRCAGLCVLGLAATWIVAELVPVTHTKDAVALHDFTELSRPRLDLLANALLGLLKPTCYILWGAALAGVALARGRSRVALAVVSVLVAAPLTAEILKPLLAHSHARVGWSVVGAASWPSGHSTAAMSLALCAVLVSPRDLRPLVAAIGTLFAVAVGFSLLVLAWHMPSDVFGGYLIAALWSAIAVAGLCLLEERRPSSILDPAQMRPSASTTTPSVERPLKGAPLVAVLIAIALAVVLRNDHPEVFAIDHLSLVIAASGIAALATVIASTFTLALRR